MQRRGFLLLCGATAVLVAAAALAWRSGPDDATAAASGGLALPRLGPSLGSLAWLRLTRGKTSVELARIDGKWVATDRGNYPADGARVRRLLLALADLTLVEPKTRLPALYPRLGVADPGGGKSTEVMVQDKAGKVVGRLIVGKRRPDRLGIGIDGTYVRRVGDARSWLARGTVDVAGGTADWLDRHLLDIPGGDIDTMILKGARHGVLVIGRNAVTAKFAVDDAAGGVTFASDAAVAAPSGALEALDLDDAEPAGSLPLPDQGGATAAFRTFDGLTVRLSLFATRKRDWVAIAAAGDGKAATAAKAIDSRLGRWVFAIPPDRAKLLRTTLSDLVAPAKKP